MRNRVKLIVALLCLFTATSRVPAASLTVQLFPVTGEVRLTNESLAPVPLAIYSIISPSGALNNSPTVWISISDNYDLSGNRLVDANNNWFKLSATAFELSEAVLNDPGGQIPAKRSISLGRVWKPLQVAFPDLLFQFNEPSGLPIGIDWELAIDGDYSGNQVVDQTDYTNWWRATFGSTTSLLADGNLNGRVDAADYVVWRNNRGLAVPLPPFASGSGAAMSSVALKSWAVPEPSSAGLLVLFLLSVSNSRWLVRQVGTRAQVASTGASGRKSVIIGQLS